jgi:hypothetical protein
VQSVSSPQAMMLMPSFRAMCIIAPFSDRQWMNASREPRLRRCITARSKSALPRPCLRASGSTEMPSSAVSSGERDVHHGEQPQRPVVHREDAVAHEIDAVHVGLDGVVA